MARKSLRMGASEGQVWDWSMLSLEEAVGLEIWKLTDSHLSQNHDLANLKFLDFSQRIKIKAPHVL